MAFLTRLCAAMLALTLATPVLAQAPGDMWMISLGGRLYDNHWLETGLEPPEGRNPLFPADIDTVDAGTWRCVSCHGWDYSGRDGHLGAMGMVPAFASLRPAAGKSTEALMQAMQSQVHAAMIEKLSEAQVRAMALFISIGQYNARKLFPHDKSVGNDMAGKDIFEGACVSCHQADGKAYIEGEQGDKPALGWVSLNRPAQAMHKITNGVPGADMLSLRFLDEQARADLLAYIQTLDPTPLE